MRVDLFDFDLPEDRIALRPAEPRDAARLLVVGRDGPFGDRALRDLPGLLRPGDALVVNDTRVIPARLEGVRVRGEAVARIKELVREGFYDGIVFHRVIEGFMAQTGCPHGTGTGGSGKKLKAEFNNQPHVRGTVSMARAQNPDSGDSQFFICFDDARFLDGQYTVWGEVTSGMENVDKIKRGEPVQNPDKIISAKMAA